MFHTHRYSASPLPSSKSENSFAFNKCTIPTINKTTNSTTTRNTIVDCAYPSAPSLLINNKKKINVYRNKSRNGCMWKRGGFLSEDCATTSCNRYPLRKYMLKSFISVWVLIELCSIQVVGASQSSHNRYNTGRMRWESLSSLAPTEDDDSFSHSPTTPVIPLAFQQSENALDSMSEPELPLLPPNPQIHSPQLKLTVPKGERVLLPCKVHNLGDNHIIWRHRLNILAGSNVSTYPDTRIQLQPDFTLEIRRVNFEDAGDYECIVTTWPRLKLTHSLSIQDPPIIHLIPASGTVETTEGQTVEIECIPSGNPKPRIVWDMRDGTIPLYPAYVNETKLTLRNVTPQFTGLYVCTADNGVGRPPFAATYVRVLYSPVINTPKRRVHGGVKAKAQLTCVVDADPKPEVQWRIGQELVPLSDRVSTHVHGNEFRLIFNPVKADDFGTYNCVANNSKGYDIKVIEFSGVPNAPIVNSWSTTIWTDKNGTQGVQVTVYWVVECYSSLIDYRLHFRDVPSKTALTSFNEDKSPAWTEITVPADQSSAFIHTKNFHIRGLQPGLIYEAVIKARNRYGWSPFSSVCHFTTFPNSSSTQQEEINERFQELNSIDSGQPGDGEDLDYSISAASSSANPLHTPLFILHRIFLIISSFSFALNYNAISSLLSNKVCQTNINR